MFKNNNPIIMTRWKFEIKTIMIINTLLTFRRIAIKLSNFSIYPTFPCSKSSIISEMALISNWEVPLFYLKYEFHTMALALLFNWEVPLFHPKYESKYDSWSHHLWKIVDSEVDWGLLGLVRKKRVEGLEILISILIMMNHYSHHD